MKKKVFVTGGCGYIGTSLVPLLLSKGYEVTVYDLLKSGGDGIVHNFASPNFNFIKGDILDKELLAESIKGHDIVVHLAAIVGLRACNRDEEMTYKVNHQGTKNVIDCLDGSQFLIYGSTGSNYGSVDGVCTEKTPLNPLSVYGKSKTLGEQEVMKYGNSTAFRFATAFGVSPRMRLDLLVNDLTYVASTQKCLVIYESHFMRTFIHVRDIARVFHFTIENQDAMRGEAYNVGSNSMNYSKKDICEMIKEKTGCYVHYADFDGDVDKRDYVVSYEKINTLGFETEIKIEEGVDELLKCFPLIRIDNKYQN